MHASKRKGTRFEQELVRKFREHGLRAKRARASDGRNLGMTPETDLVVEGKAIQAKRRAKLPKFLRISTEIDYVVFRSDFGDAKVLMSLDELVELISRAKY